MRSIGVASVFGLVGGTFGAVDVLPDVPVGALIARMELVASGLSGEVGGTVQYFPTDVAALPDGRLLVMTLGGVIRVVDPVLGLLPAPYLDVSNERTLVEPGNFGMVSVVVHPGFDDPASPGYGAFFVIETEEKGSIIADFDGSLAQVGFGGQHHDVLVEYRASDPSASVFAGTRREVLRVEQPGWDHNVFDLAFGVGDDAGLLFVASGDGANASQGTSRMRENAQTLSNVFGKVLRIDPYGTDGVNGEYGVPPGNPFVGQPGVRGEIYSYGHRAPYRLGVDRETGDVWVGEVGQRNVEEVNRIVAGGNFGWPFKEGSFLFNELVFDGLIEDVDSDGDGTGDSAQSMGWVDPVFEYDHGTGLAAIGGVVYRGERWPLLRGRYVYGDFVRGGLLGDGLFHGDPAVGPVSGGLGGVEAFRVEPGGASLTGTLFGVAEDAAGEVYLMLSGGGGTVLRLTSGCGADLSEPAGVLDLSDVNAFVAAFVDGAAPADLAAPFGVLDLSDLSAFVSSFVGGCP